MADVLGLDPARIERLRNPARYEQVNPERVWDVVERPSTGVIVDVGAGVGFVTLPLARSASGCTVVACDVLQGMLDLLREDATERGLNNVECRLMDNPSRLPLSDGAANAIVMLQVHHELGEPQALVSDCCRALAPGSPLLIVDWKDEELEGVPPAGRRVAAATIASQLRLGGFEDVGEHALFTHHSCVVGYAPRA